MGGYVQPETRFPNRTALMALSALVASMTSTKTPSGSAMPRTTLLGETDGAVLSRPGRARCRGGR